MTNFDDINENAKDGESKDETLDLFDLNIDDLGIKILGEVFLCTKCQKEIPQKDVDVTEKLFEFISKTSIERLSRNLCIVLQETKTQNYRE